MKNDPDNLNFKGSDPGAVQYGNFINYYQFNPSSNRIKLLQPDMFPKHVGPLILGLDLGCNAGDLTQDLYLNLNQIYPDIPIHVLGIDIDPTLINRAIETNKSPNISYRHLNFMDPTCPEELNSYLSHFGRTRFDFIFCFSITMWIHLNNGDSGLLAFLEKLCGISNIIIVEPQPWKCYRTAVRRMKRSYAEFPLYAELKIKGDVENVIDQTIQSQGFGLKLSAVCTTEWGRKISCYWRNNLLS